MEQCAREGLKNEIGEQSSVGESLELVSLGWVGMRDSTVEDDVKNVLIGGFISFDELNKAALV